MHSMLRESGCDVSLPDEIETLCDNTVFEGDRIIYLLNSDCSVCIRDFFEFSTMMESLDRSVPIFCMVNTNLQYRVEYFDELLTEGHPLTNIRYILSEDSYPFAFDANANVIIALKSGGYRTFLYNNGRIL